MKIEEWKVLIASPDESVRADAADNMPDDGDDEAVVSVFTRALHDESELVRTSAASTLGNCHTDGARTTLRKAITTESSELVRSFIYCSLGMIGDPEDFELLIDRFLDQCQSKRIRISCAEGLVHLTMNNMITFLTSEYQESFTQPDSLGLPSIERIVAKMDETIVHIEKVALARSQHARSVYEQSLLDEVLGAIAKLRNA